MRALTVITRHHSANACLLPLCQLHGAAITTVEGVGSTKTRIHPVQVSFTNQSHLFSPPSSPPTVLLPDLDAVSAGAHRQGSRLAVWLLYTGDGDVHVHSAEE